LIRVHFTKLLCTH